MEKRQISVVNEEDNEINSIQNEQELIEKAKKTSIKEACAWSVMDGFGLRYITPYALAVGANNFYIGLLNSLPSLLGNFSQIYTLQAMKKISRKIIVFRAVLLQAIMWLVLLSAGLVYFVFGIKNNLAPLMVVVIYTTLILFGAFGGPAWQSWMKDLVTKDSGSYFGRRSRIATTFSLLCMLIAGFILDYFQKTHVFIGFIILFSIAFFGRFISSRLTLKQHEPKFHFDESYFFSLRDFIKRMYKNNFGRFVIYFSLVSLAVNISGPFLAVYMLKDLQFSYTSFMIVSLASVLTTLLFVTPWGKFADKFGNLRTMQITGMFIPFLPLLWYFSIFFKGANSILLYLVFIECVSGMVWAGFNIAAGNFIYDAVSRQRVAICASYFNILAGSGVLVGSLLGAFISSHYSVILGMKSILFIFLFGSLIRLIVYLSMNSRIKEVRPVHDFDLKKHVKEMGSDLILVSSAKKFFELFSSPFK
jgi:MFS family permease